MSVSLTLFLQGPSKQNLLAIKYLSPRGEFVCNHVLITLTHAHSACLDADYTCRNSDNCISAMRRMNGTLWLPYIQNTELEKNVFSKIKYSIVRNENKKTVKNIVFSVKFYDLKNHS